MRSLQGNTNVDIQQFTRHVLDAGEMTRQEHLQLTSLLLSAQRLSVTERREINRIFDYVQLGRLKLID